MYNLYNQNSRSYKSTFDDHKHLFIVLIIKILYWDTWKSSLYPKLLNYAETMICISVRCLLSCMLLRSPLHFCSIRLIVSIFFISLLAREDSVIKYAFVNHCHSQSDFQSAQVYLKFCSIYHKKDMWFVSMSWDAKYFYKYFLFRKINHLIAIWVLNNIESRHFIF